jgi:hypothetical protein
MLIYSDTEEAIVNLDKFYTIKVVSFKGQTGTTAFALVGTTTTDAAVDKAITREDILKLVDDGSIFILVLSGVRQVVEDKFSDLVNRVKQDLPNFYDMI